MLSWGGVTSARLGDSTNLDGRGLRAFSTRLNRGGGSS